MDACCGPPDPTGYDAVFDERFAHRVARRYAAKGPSAVERRLLDFVIGTGIDDATVLEIGGGIGELQLELLSHGAGRTVNLELSHEYEAEAGRLIAATSDFMFVMNGSGTPAQKYLWNRSFGFVDSIDAYGGWTVVLYLVETFHGAKVDIRE